MEQGWRPQVRFGADYTGWNPYQRLLAQAVGPAVDLRPDSVAAATALQRASAFPVIYHLHWEEHVLRRACDAATGRALAQDMLDALDSFVALGGALVWTRHNLYPHDPRLREVQTEMVPHLGAMAAVIHVHSQRALEVIAAAGQALLPKTVVIGHGNYLDAYPQWPVPLARQTLGLTGDQLVLLVMGRHAASADVAATRAALAATPGDGLRFVIVGGAADDAVAQADDPRLIHVPGRAPEDRIGLYLAAADVVLLPYEASLTSGLAHLAFGMGRAVLGPHLPGLADLVRDGVTGRLYDPAQDGALADALRQAVAEGPQVWRRRGQAAAEIAACRDWGGIGLLWRGLYSSLAAAPLRGHLAQARLVAS